MKHVHAVILLVAALVGESAADAQVSVLPYAKVGYLVSSPQSTDLGYSEGGEQFFTVQKGNYGFGAQILFSVVPRKSDNVSIAVGGDIGYQHLFTSKYDLGQQGIPGISVDRWDETYNALNILGVASFMLPGPIPVDVQAGAGVYLQFYSGEYTFQGRYSSDHKTPSSTDSYFGIMASASYCPSLAKSLRLPIGVRLDNLFEWGMTTTVSAWVGLMVDV